MRKVITLAVDGKGSYRIHRGPEVPEKQQRFEFVKAKTGKLPKGVERLEMFEMFRQTTGIDTAAQADRLAQQAEADAKAPEPAAEPVKEEGAAGNNLFD